MNIDYRRFAVVFLIAVAAATACAEFDDDHDVADPVVDTSSDDRDGQAIVGGKTDDLHGECHLEHALLLVNDPATDAERLIDAGVHSQAAHEIADAGGGFSTAEELDEVPYVGPAAFRQLTGAVDDYCAGGAWRSADVVFSPKSSRETHVDRAVEKLDGAERSIDMAMYRISDRRAIDAIGDAAKRGVRVRLLFDEANGDHLRPEGSVSAELQKQGVDVRYINRSMHHKFAIVDGPQDELLQASEARFFSGSANLAYAAASIYDENTTFHRRDPALVLTMQREFNHLWDHSRDFEFNGENEDFETLAIDDQMIPDRPTLEVLFSSENFETTDSAQWGPGFRPEPYGDAVYSRLVDLISESNDSVWVAARFLRSRPIAEAIMERRRDDPELDIRVYLDQAEYIDGHDYDEQQDELAECLIEAADDELEEYHCRERGRLFSYALFEADVPLRFKTYAYRWHFTYAEQMHHKYIVVDEAVVATGSYNYSNNAEQNSMENVIVYHRHEYPDVVDAFVDNFEHLWITGVDDGSPDDWLADKDSADAIDLIFDPVALSWPEFGAFQHLVEERCPVVHTDEFDSNPTDYTQCEP